MPAFEFNSQGIDPQYGAGSSQLPLGKHPVVIVGSELKPTRDGQGGYMALTLEAIDGPAKGVQHTDRLNLHNKNADTVRIANQQLSAYCHVTGVFGFKATEELHGKPFVVDIVPDGGSNAREGQTKVGGLFDINGNAPGQAGSGAQSQGGGFGGATGGGQGQGQGGGAWGGGAPAGDQQQQGGGNGGNAWGGGNNGGGQGGGAAPAGGGAGAWSQGGGQGGGTPGWGAR